MILDSYGITHVDVHRVDDPQGEEPTWQVFFSSLRSHSCRQRPSVLGIISGMFSGLVTITAGAGYVNVTGAFCMGFLAGPVCYFAAQLKHRFGYDDALDAFGIHAPGGALGGILTGFFATEVSPGGWDS